MLRRPGFCILILFACSIANIPLVSGAVWNIPQGGTVFISEEGLDLTATGITNGSQIGWWGPGESRVSSPPGATVTVVDATYFVVSSVLFEGKTGPWYLLPNRSMAIIVDDSRTVIRVFDETAGVESTNAWVPRGDVVSFRLDTNLYQMNERPGVKGASMILHMKAPSGARYKALIGPNGTSTTITDITVPSSAYSTGPIWDTGNVLYKPGTYSIYAETDAENSDTVTFLLQDSNPLLSGGTGVGIQTVTTAIVTVIPTATPNISRIVLETAATIPAKKAMINSNETIMTIAPATAMTDVPTPVITIRTAVPSPTATTPVSITVTTPTLPPTTVATLPTTPGFGVLTSVMAGIAMFCIMRRK